jgi:hypothetical protein
MRLATLTLLILAAPAAAADPCPKSRAKAALALASSCDCPKEAPPRCGKAAEVLLAVIAQIDAEAKSLPTAPPPKEKAAPKCEGCDGKCSECGPGCSCPRPAAPGALKAPAPLYPAARAASRPGVCEGGNCQPVPGNGLPAPRAAFAPRAADGTARSGADFLRLVGSQGTDDEKRAVAAAILPGNAAADPSLAVDAEGRIHIGGGVYRMPDGSTPPARSNLRTVEGPATFYPLLPGTTTRDPNAPACGPGGCRVVPPAAAPAVGSRFADVNGCVYEAQRQPDGSVAYVRVSCPPRR